MSDPKVSFVIPCYRLAHYLGECLESILIQSYKSFEILVMDDCSPDKTGEVVNSFKDPRIRYIRNDPNLGHLRNYNKGIELSNGEYVWLISADDRLAKPYVLEKYMAVLETHPQIGYAFCPATGLFDERETGLEEYSFHGEFDRIFNGKKFLTDSLLKKNGVPAASGMVRRTCYEQLGAFPLDMPYAGDWYLWCLFALHFDVAYFSEAMVQYRKHTLAMTSTLSRENVRACVEDDLALPFRIYREARKIPDSKVMDACSDQMAIQLGQYLSGAKVRGAHAQITLEEFEHKLANFTSNEDERSAIAQVALALAGDRFLLRTQLAEARAMYWGALRLRPFWPKLWVKVLLTKSQRSLDAIRAAKLQRKGQHAKAGTSEML